MKMLFKLHEGEQSMEKDLLFPNWHKKITGKMSDVYKLKYRFQKFLSKEMSSGRFIPW